jgi:hypothetical protein
MRGFTGYLVEDCLGGPRPWKLSWVINFQKAGTFFFLAFLIWYYQNFSTVAWIYLALHGSYGLIWIMKDVAFPDAAWQKKITIGGGIAAFAGVLGWYWVFGWLRNRPPPLSLAGLRLVLPVHQLMYAGKRNHDRRRCTEVLYVANETRSDNRRYAPLHPPPELSG